MQLPASAIPGERMQRGATFLRSSIGQKAVMAVSGLVLYAFVIGHMLGNLQIFLGPEKINSYAALLKATPALLWSARIGLLFIATLHVVAATVWVLYPGSNPYPNDYRDPWDGDDSGPDEFGGVGAIALRPGSSHDGGLSAKIADILAPAPKEAHSSKPGFSAGGEAAASRRQIVSSA